ncbi:MULTISPECIES: hypothetical protein [Novosphingobium]|uniref:Uncharacterized protein n=2 Tax=Novosphingobium TaxID=165696 RepID=A0ABT0ADJ0_9SPHN|nr:MULTISPECIES: hypothetical protein [Novosphingobium]MCJ1961229.1 hypothetical protein [Novosphingobium mangrovi (ex Hu et al. 2023)]MED5543859.1 hypothetical protein [Pseudomonadota bacterium]
MDSNSPKASAAFPDRKAHEAAPASGRPAATLDWRRRMSDHIAYALLVYTALQIFVTIGALKAGEGSLLPYFALIVLVLAIIPACRRFEARWNSLTDREARDPALAPACRRDCLLLWGIAIGLPFALTGLFKVLGLLFA